MVRNSYKNFSGWDSHSSSGGQKGCEQSQDLGWESKCLLFSPSARKQTSIEQAIDVIPPLGAAGDRPFSLIDSNPVSQQASKLRDLFPPQTLKSRGSNVRTNPRRVAPQHLFGIVIGPRGSPQNNLPFGSMTNCHKNITSSFVVAKGRGQQHLNKVRSAALELDSPPSPPLYFALRCLIQLMAGPYIP